MGIRGLAILALGLSACGQPEVVAEGEHISGKEFFNQRCAECHGIDGTACVSDASDLSISKLNGSEIRAVIMEGKGGMPPFKTMISAEETTEELVEYVESMRK